MAEPPDARYGSGGRPLRVHVEHDLEGDRATLAATETHYLAHVLRLRRGHRLVLFNGRGSEREALLDELTRQSAVLTLGANLEPLPAPRLELCLLQGLPKADAMDWIVCVITRSNIVVAADILLVSAPIARPFNRAAFWLLTFTFVYYTLALGLRMYISGRPPVTNLYSSAVFIGWGCVLMGLIFELIYRIGIGNTVAAIAGSSTLKPSSS